MNPASFLMKRLHAPVYRSRQAALVRHIVPNLRPHDRVLDVGCGSGALGAALLAEQRVPGLEVEGLERMARGGEPIPVHAYPGGRMPFPDAFYDVVIVADVLHHETDPDGLLQECARVSRRLVIIKDHQLCGFLAWSRIALLDWAANAPHGVPCPFKYNTADKWKAVPAMLGMRVIDELDGMHLYPFPYETVFGGGLQYFSVLSK